MMDRKGLSPKTTKGNEKLIQEIKECSSTNKGNSFWFRLLGVSKIKGSELQIHCKCLKEP